MRAIRFVLPAELEMLEAAKFYEQQARNLGADFLRTVEHVVFDLNEYPLLWPVVHSNIRKRIIPRFPYAVLYRVDLKEIVIIAIMHLHRNPNYWIER